MSGFPVQNRKEQCFKHNFRTKVPVEILALRLINYVTSGGSLNLPATAFINCNNHSNLPLRTMVMAE